MPGAPAKGLATGKAGITPKLGRTLRPSSYRYRSSRESSGDLPAPSPRWYRITLSASHVNDAGGSVAPSAFSGSIGMVTSLTMRGVEERPHRCDVSVTVERHHVDDGNVVFVAIAYRMALHPEGNLLPGDDDGLAQHAGNGGVART